MVPYTSWQQVRFTGGLEEAVLFHLTHWYSSLFDILVAECCRAHFRFQLCPPSDSSQSTGCEPVYFHELTQHYISVRPGEGLALRHLGCAGSTY